MSPPPYIYSSTLSRRDRSWKGPRRRRLRGVRILDASVALALSAAALLSVFSGHLLG